jgi:precorrin-3B synthase
MLVRIRVPGGALEPQQLTEIAQCARTYGDGNIDITSRANIQLRGLQRESLENFAGALERCGLLPSRAHDRVRNIAASPLTGADPSEIVDTFALVRELDAALIAADDLAALPAKFAFAMDGGGRAFHAEEADLSLCAVAEDDGVRFHLLCAGVPTGMDVLQRHAVETLIGAARCALEQAQEYRMAQSWRVAALPDLREAIVERLGGAMRPCLPPPSRPKPVSPLGMLQSADPARTNIVPCIALGRISCAQASAIAEMAQAHGAGLRLAWWRGIVLASVPVGSSAEILRNLAAIGMPVDRSSGYAGIAACSGMAGCTNARADVRAHAAQLAGRITRTEVAQEWNVNIAACEKRCAMRGGAHVELVASASGYDVSIGGVTVAWDVNPDAALDAAAAAGTRVR